MVRLNVFVIIILVFHISTGGCPSHHLAGVTSGNNVYHHTDGTC